MPLPFILGGLAIAAAGYGAKKGYDGYQTKSEADEIMNNLKERHESAESSFNRANNRCNESLEELGNHQLQIGKEFSEFKEIADRLLKDLGKGSSNKDLHFTIPKSDLDKIESVSFSAMSYLGSVAKAGAVGAGIAYAVYGGVLTLGVASTGTAIGTLSGVAATNAALAALGGGSLAAGGLGMAGGTMVLGATVAAPILAVAGWAYNSYAEKALEEAYKTKWEVDEAIYKMELAIQQFEKLQSYAIRMDSAIKKIHAIFSEYFEHLKAVNSIGKISPDMLKSMIDEILSTINNGLKVAAILAGLVTTPLFKIKKDNNGLPVLKDDLPQFETDENGLQVINEQEISDKILKSDQDINTFSQEHP